MYTACHKCGMQNPVFQNYVIQNKISRKKNRTRFERLSEV